MIKKSEKKEKELEGKTIADKLDNVVKDVKELKGGCCAFMLLAVAKDETKQGNKKGHETVVAVHGTTNELAHLYNCVPEHIKFAGAMIAMEEMISDLGKK